MYLMIENKGVAPLEAYTLLGDSGTRNRDSDRLIGQFGSGNKLGITMLIRQGIGVIIYCGKNKLEFYPEVITVTEADGTRRDSHPIKCKVSGQINRTIDCGWTAEMGIMDWNDPCMAVREFVSNALDCSVTMNSEPVIKVSEPRARDGYTRVFVEMAPKIAKFYMELGENFLHFSDDPSQVGQRFLKKNPRCKGPIIYLNGVKIRELRSSEEAAFDYNFARGEIKIDEARNSSEYSLRASIAQVIGQADAQTLAQLFTVLSERDSFEGSLDSYYLGYYTTDNNKAQWQEAWRQFAGDAVIASLSLETAPIVEHARRKGHKVQTLKSPAFVEVAKKMGVPELATILGSQAACGRVECDPTEEAIKAVNTVWSWVEAANMTNSKPRPQIKSFRQIMDGESECLGYHVLGSDQVCIRDDLDGKIALKTAIEEVAHYVTGSTDLSRDFQNYAFDMIVELCC